MKASDVPRLRPAVGPFSSRKLTDVRHLRCALAMYARPAACAVGLAALPLQAWTATASGQSGAAGTPMVHLAEIARIVVPDGLLLTGAAHLNDTLFVGWSGSEGRVVLLPRDGSESHHKSDR